MRPGLPSTRGKRLTEGTETEIRGRRLAVAEWQRARDRVFLHLDGYARRMRKVYCDEGLPLSTEGRRLQFQEGGFTSHPCTSDNRIGATCTNRCPRARTPYAMSSSPTASGVLLGQDPLRAARLNYHLSFFSMVCLEGVCTVWFARWLSAIGDRTVAFCGPKEHTDHDEKKRKRPIAAHDPRGLQSGRGSAWR